MTDRVDFTNSDSDLMRTFLKFFRTGFEVEESKFRVCVHIHEYHDAVTQLKYWSHITGIPHKQFIKSYMKPHTGKQVRENYQGCASVRYHDANMARQLHAIAKASFKLFK